MHTTRAIAHQLGAVRHLQGYPLLGYEVSHHGQGGGVNLHHGHNRQTTILPGAIPIPFPSRPTLFLHICTSLPPLLSPCVTRSSPDRRSASAIAPRGLGRLIIWLVQAPERGIRRIRPLVVYGSRSHANVVPPIEPRLPLLIERSYVTVLDCRRAIGRNADRIDEGRGRGARSVAMRGRAHFQYRIIAVGR